MMCVPIELGRVPLAAVLRHNQPALQQEAGCPLQFGPNEERQISLAGYAAGMKAFVQERQPFFRITSCFIHLEGVYFDDGMKWVPGYYSVPDPSSPELERSMALGFFPGVPQPNTRSGSAGAERRNAP
jgi:hypothetical protein